MVGNGREGRKKEKGRGGGSFHRGTDNIQVARELRKVKGLWGDDLPSGRSFAVQAVNLTDPVSQHFIGHSVLVESQECSLKEHYMKQLLVCVLF